jgi:formylmethanofuran dehydrogenase subunit E
LLGNKWSHRNKEACVIKEKSMNSQELTAVIQFHGYFFPGLTIGERTAELALDEIGPHAADEEEVAIVETDMCGVDAIQFMTGCTFGKGNLIHLEYGKNTFTFIRRSDSKAIRLVMRPQSRGESNDEQRELTARFRSRKASPEEHERFPDLLQQSGKAILDLPGEMVMETRLRLLGGRKLCIPCFETGESDLYGYVSMEIFGCN